MVKVGEEKIRKVEACRKPSIADRKTTQMLPSSMG
jgi:hypothetical protein